MSGKQISVLFSSSSSSFLLIADYRSGDETLVANLVIKSTPQFSTANNQIN